MNREGMTKTYVTFGQVHAHSVNGKTFDKDCVAIIYAKDQEEGRDLVFRYFGPKFFTTYYETAWNPSDLRFFPRGYIEVN